MGVKPHPTLFIYQETKTVCNLPQDDFNLDFQGLANCINALTGLVVAVDNIIYRYHITARRAKGSSRNQSEFYYREIKTTKELEDWEVSELAFKQYPELKGRSLSIQMIGRQ